MSVESISYIQPIELNADALHANSVQQLQGAESFMDVLASQLDATNQSILYAQDKAQSLALGEEENLHQVMIAISKAKTNFELTVEIRNKLLEGFQEVMRMQM